MEKRRVGRGEGGGRYEGRGWARMREGKGDMMGKVRGEDEGGREGKRKRNGERGDARGGGRVRHQ